MYKLKQAANIGGILYPAGSTVPLSPQKAAGFLEAGTVEIVDKQPAIAETETAKSDRKKSGKESEKSDEFSRVELNELAVSLGVDSPEKLSDKAAVVEAIKAVHATLSEAKPGDQSQAGDKTQTGEAAGAKADAGTVVQGAGTTTEAPGTGEDNTGDKKPEETSTEKPIGRSSKK